MEETPLNFRLKVVTEDTFTRIQRVAQEVAEDIWVLGGGGGAVWGMGLLSILTGSTGGMAVARASDKTNGKLVQETSKSQFLDMLKGKVSQLDVPAEPNFLQRGQVTVG